VHDESVVAGERGGPEALQFAENDLREPMPSEVCTGILTAPGLSIERYV
jgi:hypothetical protein